MVSSYSSFEKEIITKLTNYYREHKDNPNLMDFVINQIEDDFAVYIFIEQKELKLFYKEFRQIELFLEIISIIDFLIKEKLIFTHILKKPLRGNFISTTLSTDDINDKITNIEVNKDTLKVTTIQTNIFDMILNYTNSFYLPTFKLRHLIDNDFKSEEQIRFEIQLQDEEKKHQEAMKKANLQIKIGWIALAIAIISIIVSMLIQC